MPHSRTPPIRTTLENRRRETVMVAVALPPPGVVVAVTTVVPGAFPITRPSGRILAIFGSPISHWTVPGSSVSPVAVITTADKERTSFGAMVSLLGSIAKARSLGGVGLVGASPWQAM